MATTGYLCLLASRDITARTDLDNLPIELSIIDNTTTFEMDIADDGSSNPVGALQEIVIIDGATANPTINLLLDPLMSHVPLGGTVLFQPQSPRAIGGWWSLLQAPGFGGAGGLITEGPPTAISTANATGDTYIEQWTQPLSIADQQSYMLSVYATITAPLSNAQIFLALIYRSPSGAALASGRQTWATLSGTQRISYQLAAPAGTASIDVQIGLTTTSGTNSGAATFASAQLEPLWWPTLQSYPTPDCNSLQSGCYVIPNGTTIRQNRIFTGFTVDGQPDYDNGFDRTWHVGVRGVNWLLETQFVNATFNQQTDAAILTTLIAQLFPNRLSANNVEQGATIDTRTYDDVQFSEVCNDLANTTGFLIYVDNYYDVHYAPVGGSLAPYGLSDNPDNITTFEYHDWQPQSFDATQMGNRVTVHGGAFTQTTQETFTPASGTSVTLSNPAPKTVTSVTVNGVEQIKGVSGNANTTFANGYQCLIDFPNHKVVFPASIAGNTIVVTYTFDSQIRAQEMDLLSYDTYKIWIDRKVSDTTIVSTAAASQRALQELANYAFPLVAPQFKTYSALWPGQSVAITNSKEGYNATLFLVQQVTIHLKGEGTTEYEVICGADIPSFTRHVRNLHRVTMRSKALAGQPLSSIGLCIHEAIATGVDSGPTGRYS